MQREHKTQLAAFRKAARELGATYSTLTSARRRPVPRMRRRIAPMKTLRATSTFGDLHRATPWLWLNCQHYAPLACAVPVIRWGLNTSSDKLRQCTRCTACGSKGATIQHPGWGGADVGFLPFPAAPSARRRAPFVGRSPANAFGNAWPGFSTHITRTGAGAWGMRSARHLWSLSRAVFPGCIKQLTRNRRWIRGITRQIPQNGRWRKSLARLPRSTVVRK